MKKTQIRACPWSRQGEHTDWWPNLNLQRFWRNTLRHLSIRVLSRAALETLSIIAYKQPITRIEIDAIRGVNSSGALAKLQAFDLIREDGKKEVLGRPNLYVTTDYFLDYMGINHLEELPVIDELEIQAQESQLFGERIEEDENQ